jgi:hypothetical protein
VQRREESAFQRPTLRVRQPERLGSEDRQCAWELYVEMATRLAVTGQRGDPSEVLFEGEVFAESLQSLYQFFQEVRSLMRRMPVGAVPPASGERLGAELIADTVLTRLRTFLEHWQADFRYWWETGSDADLPPLERQQRYPRREQFLTDWAALRRSMRAIAEQLAQVYQFADSRLL